MARGSVKPIQVDRNPANLDEVVCEIPPASVAGCLQKARMDVREVEAGPGFRR